jgi:hypothetical protein
MLMRATPKILTVALRRFDLKFHPTQTSNSRSMIACRVPLALLALTALFAACRKPAVETYRVPKEPTAQTPTPASPHTAGASTSAAPGGNAMANTPVATASGSGLTWTAPAHWKTKTGSAMRKGSYALTADGVTGEADMSITAFPGDVGGDLANLNRWRGQLQLPPVGQAEFDAQTQHLDRNDLHMTVVDITGKGQDGSPHRTLGAMVPHGGATWFFKLQGPEPIVAKEKTAFMAMLDTIKPAAAK